MNSTKKKEKKHRNRKKRRTKKKPPSRVGDRNAGSRPQPGFSCQSTLFLFLSLSFSSSSYLPSRRSERSCSSLLASSFSFHFFDAIVLATFYVFFSSFFSLFRSSAVESWLWRSRPRKRFRICERRAVFSEFFSIYSAKLPNCRRKRIFLTFRFDIVPPS